MYQHMQAVLGFRITNYIGIRICWDLPFHICSIYTDIDQKEGFRTYRTYAVGQVGSDKLAWKKKDILYNMCIAFMQILTGNKELILAHIYMYAY